MLYFCSIYSICSSILILHILISSTKVSGDLSNSYFYIYEWPLYLHDVWPPLNASLGNVKKNKTSSYSHKFRGNNGAGEGPIGGDGEGFGYYNTWQFAMYQLVMARLRTSRYRTLDPSKASIFIIPFDIGVHSFVDHHDGHSRVASPHGWRAVEYLNDIVKKKDSRWDLLGHNHFVFFSITSYQILGIGAKVFLCTVCQNCSVLTIETTPTFTARKYYSRKSRKWWYSVPYPSSFHWHEGIKTLPWEMQEKSARPYLAIFIGSPITLTPMSNMLRKKLQSDCQESRRVGRLTDCLWFDAEHTCAGVVNQTNAMIMYRHSVFCLTPMGDSLTRKSLFDSLLTGCIPVVFAKATINQYVWHLPPHVISQVSIFILAESVINGEAGVLSILRSISSSQIERMQKKIEEIAPSLQYSVVPDGYGSTEKEALSFFELSRYGYLNKKQYPALVVESDPNYKYKGPVWNPPFPDAVDIIIEKILNRNTIEPIQGFTTSQVIEYDTLRDNITNSDPAYAGYLSSNSQLSIKPKLNKYKKKRKGSSL